MSCKPTYKGVRYNSLEELYKANGVNPQQKQQAQQVNTTVKEGMYVFAVDGNNANSSEVLLHITNISKINKNVKAANMPDFTSLPIEIKERILKRTLRSGYSDNVIMNASKNSPGFIIEFTVVPETEYSEPVDKIESISNETITLMDKITTDSNLVPVLFTNNNGALIGQGKDISKIVDENMSSVKYGNTNLELVKGDRDVVAIRMFEDFKNLSDNFVDVIQELITFAVNNADTQFVMSLDEFINGETTIAGRRIADLVNALYDLKAKAPNVIIVSSENVQTGVLALSYAVMSLGESLTNNIC